MKSQTNIASELTKYLAKIMFFSAICILIISTSYSLVLYSQQVNNSKLILNNFINSILPSTTHDMYVGNTTALRVRTEFIVLKERDQNFQAQVLDSNDKIVYQSDAFENKCDGSKFFTSSKTIIICNQENIVYQNQNFGVLKISKEIDSFYAFLIGTKIPILFLILFFLFSLFLIIIRYSLKIKVIGPLYEIIKTLKVDGKNENKILRSHGVYEWRILSESIEEYKSKILNFINSENESHTLLQKQKLLSEVTSQLAHDIRSPLAALDMVAAHVDELEEEKRLLIRDATTRIHNIANNLIDRNFNKNQTITSQMLPSIIRQMVFEKREQYKAKNMVQIIENIDAESYGIFSKIDVYDFKRILSNIIDNSVQAIVNSGEVVISLYRENNQIQIDIKDNGRGIPKEVMPKICTKGFTYQKKGGTGLGLYYTVQKINEWGGKIEIDSEVNVGTTVSIILKEENAPKWFVSEIVVRDNDNFVILDDDQTIHSIWKSRFSFNSKIKLFHFQNEFNFVEWFKHHDIGNVTYLFDYELIGATRTGLNIIEDCGISLNVILVTSHYENEKIQKKCDELNVKIIPKQLAGFVPIRTVLY
jgi:signal transduction histidine kinase